MLSSIVRRFQYAGIGGVIQAGVHRVMPARIRHGMNDPHIYPVMRYLERQPAFSIIQIGAYVGDSGNDPLAKFLKRSLPRHPRSKVVLVEPVKGYFDQLCANYATLPGVLFENVAIAETHGERTFYYLDANPVAHGYPEWLSQLSSLRADRMTTAWDAYERDKGMQAFYLAHRAQTTVQCVTLQSLVAKHRITELDLLQIDAEGYDYEILKSIDFNRVKPRFINFEHTLISADERAECRAMMERAGYTVHQSFGEDTLCRLISRPRSS